MIKLYNKLVRDKIPEIIEKDNKTCNTVILDDESFLVELNAKLKEETAEYLESGSVEELADIAEVIEGILLAKGVSIGDFHRIKQDKKDKRGGFDKKIFLLDVEE